MSRVDEGVLVVPGARTPLLLEGLVQAKGGAAGDVSDLIRAGRAKTVERKLTVLVLDVDAVQAHNMEVHVEPDRPIGTLHHDGQPRQCLVHAQKETTFKAGLFSTPRIERDGGKVRLIQYDRHDTDDNGSITYRYGKDGFEFVESDGSLKVNRPH